jgi:translation initiation factor 2 gamma subunit (eIF-2gamma)
MATRCDVGIQHPSPSTGNMSRHFKHERKSLARRAGVWSARRVVRICNLGILAHVDAGKTTLTERLLFAAGVIDEVGSVDAGSTQTDSLALERQRGITIKSAVVSFVVGDTTVNLIDTPGHPDFIAEVERVLGVLDGVVLVVSAVEGCSPRPGCSCGPCSGWASRPCCS